MIIFKKNKRFILKNLFIKTYFSIITFGDNNLSIENDAQSPYTC